MRVKFVCQKFSQRKKVHVPERNNNKTFWRSSRSARRRLERFRSRFRTAPESPFHPFSSSKSFHVVIGDLDVSFNGDGQSTLLKCFTISRFGQWCHHKQKSWSVLFSYAELHILRMLKIKRSSGIEREKKKNIASPICSERLTTLYSCVS